MDDPQRCDSWNAPIVFDFSAGDRFSKPAAEANEDIVANLKLLLVFEFADSLTPLHPVRN